MSGHIKSRQVELVVVTPEALILGKEEYHIEQGSIISLVCIIENSLLTPEYVFWYQDDRMINYDTNHGVQVQTTVGKKTSSRLNIKRSADGVHSAVTRKKQKYVCFFFSALPHHSGNYTCQPSSAIPASIQVFVLGKQYPASS